MNQKSSLFEIKCKNPHDHATLVWKVEETELNEEGFQSLVKLEKKPKYSSFTRSLNHHGRQIGLLQTQTSILLAKNNEVKVVFESDGDLDLADFPHWLSIEDGDLKFIFVATKKKKQADRLCIGRPTIVGKPQKFKISDSRFLHCAPDKSGTKIYVLDSNYNLIKC